MKNREVSHDTWITPRDFYYDLNARFCFDFDPCSPYFGIDPCIPDGLTIDWGDRTYCNPPYSQKLKEAFIHKALAESQLGKLVVLLLPVSTSTRIFHQVIQPHGQIEFIRGRLPFEGINSKGEWVNPHMGQWELPHIPSGTRRVKNSGQHDSMIVIFGGDNAQG